MTVKPPTRSQIAVLANDIGLSLSDAEMQSYESILAGMIEPFGIVDAMPDALPRVSHPRTPGYRPAAEENRHNAWYWKTSVKGAARGKLSGKRVALKDNVMLAGVPMMNGVATLEGYVPEIDATIVTRMLDAGAEIVGKAHCEALCLSGSSHTNATGPIHNPYRMGYSAGGSSSGSAVLVALGEVDMAIGGDQGGSIRMPASLCGIYGMKPTWGLVPYTGIMPIEIFVDHAGPMTANVVDNATLLEVLAGDDGYDFRQKDLKLHRYSKDLDAGVKGMKIAVVAESFGLENGMAEVDAKVRQGAKRFEAMGAKVDEISIPFHALGRALWMPVGVGGLTQTMMWGDGYGVSRPDLYVTSLMDYHRGWRHRADELPTTVKMFTLLGTYINRQYGNRHYGKAVNLVKLLRGAYDAVLRDYDLLLMPTTPGTSGELPAVNSPPDVYLARASTPLGNTAQFDLSHHPAMSIPCGMHDGLPIGMMLVGRHFDEPTIYRAAFAFEQAGDWKAF